MHKSRTSSLHGWRPLTLLIVVLQVTSSSPVSGQGSRADYERAAALRELVRGKVLNETLSPSWLSDHRLLYRRQIALDQWSFVTVDARTGQKEAAFDHQEVSRLIGQALGRELDADRLPFERLIQHDQELAVLLENEPRVFVIAPGGSRVFEAALETVDGLRLTPTRQRRSRDEGTDTTVLFVNRADEAVQTVWLDRDGNRQPYVTLQPGDAHRQHTYAGHVWLVRGEDGRELGTFKAGKDLGVVVIDGRPQVLPPGVEDQPRTVSPDGSLEAIIRDHNVFIRDLATRGEYALSLDGTKGDAYSDRLLWSPDSRWLAVVRVVPAEEHDVHLIETSPQDRVQPRLHTHQYLKPGDRIERPRLCIFDVDRRRQIPVSQQLFSSPWSISELRWAPDGLSLSFLYNQRGHQVLRLIAVEAATGAARVIIEERSDTFIDYANKLYLKRLDESGEAIWMSERDGWNHLYLMDMATGQVKNQITGGAWVVRGVEEVDEHRRQIRFRAVGVHEGQDPYHVHYGRVGFDGSGLTWLTRGDGTHQLHFSPTGEFYLDAYSRVDQPPVHELRRSADGSLICELERADWSALLETGWRPPERHVAKGRDSKTDIWGLIFYPSTFDPEIAYSVIENIYAGPHGHFVPKQFSAWDDSREVAELGFIVVRIDGMGTNWRSKRFHDVCWKNLGDSGFPDRVAWLEAAARDRPFMDLTRVGIYGGSAGGQSALRALLAHGDFYQAAVADCGCHDNRMDKIWWNELWMGWPPGPHYAEQSNVTQAHRLQGDLLLIVGELDRNVDPASTMQVVNALIKADRDFELLVMPGVGHAAAETPYGRRRRQDFFVRHLLGAQPRWSDPDTTPARGD